jgi:hypothetical protein
MRRALATVTIAGAVALVPFTAATASADSTSAGVTVLAEDVDEPLENDGDDDTGKYGLIGLTGLFGLFGYKKYKEHRATTTRSTTTGTHGDGTTGGTSRRV